MKIKKLCALSMLLAIAIVLNIIESLIPLPIPIPGVRLGLANAVVLIVLYISGIKEAFMVMILRVLFVGLFRGNIMQLTWFMSLSGSLISFIFMAILSKIKIFSIIGTSIVGAIGHTIGQIIVCIILLEIKEFLYYLPIIAILSVITGTFTGFLSKTLINRNIINKLLE